MGYGGALIWTGLARNLKRIYPNKKVLFIYKKSPKSALLRKPHPDHIIFKNNPDIEAVISKLRYFFSKKKYNKKEWIIVDMDNPDLLYWEKDTKEKMFFKKGKHAIEIMCQYFNIEDCVIRPVLRLTGKEQGRVSELLKEHNLGEKKFIVVEPNIKKSAFGINREWFWDRWQELTDLLTREAGAVVVQIGVAGAPVLSGVVNLTGKTSFRTAAGIIGKAKLFIGYEGGFNHASVAMNTKSIILVSAYEPDGLLSYPNNVNIYKRVECAGCGLKTPCPYDRKCMRQITVDEVYNNVLKLLKI